MTLPKILLLIALVTFSVFLYAHEQVSKVILLYDIQHYQSERALLSDTHNLLKYQVSVLTSSPSLETALAKRNLLLDMPEDREVIHLAMKEKNTPLPKQKKDFLGLISVINVAEAGSR